GDDDRSLVRAIDTTDGGIAPVPRDETGAGAGVALRAEDDLHHGACVVRPPDRPRDRIARSGGGYVARLGRLPRRPRDRPRVVAGRDLIPSTFAGKGHDPRASVGGIAHRHPTAIGDRLLARGVGRHPDERDVRPLLAEEERPTAPL